MNKSTVAVLSLCGLAVGFGIFFFSSFNIDEKQALEQYSSITSGKQKPGRGELFDTSRVLRGAKDEAANNSGGSWSGTSCPESTDVAEWRSYIESCTMSDERRKMILEGLRLAEKKITYHQFRAGEVCEAADACRADNGGTAASITAAEFTASYNYNVAEPLALDCSYFVKHCLWAAGIEVAASNTGGFASRVEVKAASELIPGDITVKAGNHVMIYLGTNSAGENIFVHERDHANDCVVSTGTFREKTGAIPELTDRSFSAPSGTGSGTSGGTSGTYTNGQSIKLDSSWKYADKSKTNSGSAKYYVSPTSNGKVVCVNAGHGSVTATKSANKTLSHPDGTAKVTGGTNQGVESSGASSGTTNEAGNVLKASIAMKDKLLALGYDVVMIRETDADCNLDNIARTVISNNTCNIMVSVHYDGNSSGGYFNIYQLGTYATSWDCGKWFSKQKPLGDALSAACVAAGNYLNTSYVSNNDTYNNDLTQYCYSTTPTIDVELGSYSVDSSNLNNADWMKKQGEALATGVDNYFKGGN